MSRKSSTAVRPRQSNSREEDAFLMQTLQNLQLPSPVHEGGENFFPAREGRLYSSRSTFDFLVHKAVQNGETRALNKFLDSPTLNLFKQDLSGRTILHYAANYANQKIALKMTTAILNCKSLLGTENFHLARADLINVQDNCGETALHLSAKNCHRKIVQQLLFLSADVNLKSMSGKEPIELIYSKVPQAMCALFDTAITYHSGEIGDDTFKVLLDFGPIVGFDENDEKDNFRYFFMESALLACALKNSGSKCKEILIHPLVRLFLHFKWNKVRILFWTSIILHFVWHLEFSAFLLDLYLHSCPYILDIDGDQDAANSLELNDTSQTSESADSAGSEIQALGILCPKEKMGVKLALSTAIVTALMGTKEIYELCSVPSFSYYFSKLENLGQLVLVVLVALTTLPVWNSVAFDHPVIIRPWQYQAAAFGIFLAWILTLSQLGKTPRLGLYIEILLRVLKSFGLFVLTFSALLIAFALSFSILMPQTEPFSSWPLALSKALFMMTGELDYADVFHNDENLVHFRVTSHLLYASFCIVVTIILFNLLLGLTISDIQGLQAGANISLLSGQLEQIVLMESFLFSKPMKLFLKTLRLKADFFRQFQISTIEKEVLYGVIIPIKSLPKELRNEVKDLALKNMNRSNDLSQFQSKIDDERRSSTLSDVDLLRSLIKEVLSDTLNEHFKDQRTQQHQRQSETGTNSEVRLPKEFIS